MVLCILAGNFDHLISYAPWNLENIRKSSNNLSFLCQFFINELQATQVQTSLGLTCLHLSIMKIIINNQGP